jgi:hypothetical protein
MVSDGQLGFGTTLALCLIGGSLLGIVAISLRGPGRPPARRAGAPPSPSSEIPAESAIEPEAIGQPANYLDARPITSSRVGDDLWDGR